ALALIGQRIASVFDLSSVRVVLGDEPGDARHEAIALRGEGERVGTLLIPAGIAQRARERILRGVVPALTAVLRAAQERERLVAEAVQTEGLRRSEAIKTAVLRAVSHDLRSPLTAMITAGAAVRAPGITAPERDELGGLVQQEGTRLAKLIDDLLDLSRLEANAALPQVSECSVEEVVDSALAAQSPASEFDVAIDADLPPVNADFVQIERALANIMENAVRYAAGQPVVVRARLLGDRVAIRIADRGPGISPADQGRIFEPFYRAGRPDGDGGAAVGDHAGSGLGLAIARGFVETNGGRLRVESAPGRGSVFVIELPVAAQGEPAVAPVSEDAGT
ncbi:MAG: sensor histidine kinase, partial [Solirubrobacteraceae bacterium]